MFGKPSDNKKAALVESEDSEEEKPKPKKGGKKAEKDVPVANQRLM